MYKIANSVRVVQNRTEQNRTDSYLEASKAASDFGISMIDRPGS